MTLLVTIAIEAVVDLLYCRIRTKPIANIVTTGVWANFWTQTGLWVIFKLLPNPYLPTLVGAELLIWFIEGLCFVTAARNQLNFREGELLSLLRNLTSFGFGLILPI